MSEQEAASEPVEVEEEAPELVDPAVEIREKCTQTKECAALLEKFNACNERVSSKSATTETCVEEQSDFLHCVDHCFAPKLFKLLK
ncbi:cytochrome b-c1 complex subunit 6, mitochondrial-like isoform X1 [Daphnia pulex]|uniref:cytochrome b-c1 complex subunit 6, mitochondrial-like isoform X1 n=1 Tax=Daphnia pulex TaxID=6669 RepID=UPI001EDFDBBC|nr:cytochrome b-c1 complex subunit 6, mitochondrial-like isoform X1 [Daphnia pulex]XP_046657113.1 cytochrome b-c1 complex subunit 6, mitochondrial-like isoform X1 [Daphnia pulicaria]